jgi:hypothetical protein
MSGASMCRETHPIRFTHRSEPPRSTRHSTDAFPYRCIGWIGPSVNHTTLHVPIVLDFVRRIAVSQPCCAHLEDNFFEATGTRSVGRRINGGM